jgi:hypothetical protein
MYDHKTGQDEHAPTTHAEFEPDQPTDQPAQEDAIRLRAYFIWEQRIADGVEGTADQDWFQAEAELEGD